MNEYGYELVPVEAVGAPSRKKRGVYHAMLEDFAAMPYGTVEVRYGERGTQAVYMGLRVARDKASPTFDFIRIRREGSSDIKGKVYLEK